MILSKSVVADLLNGIKLDGDNNKSWHKKTRYFLNVDCLNAIKKEVVAPMAMHPQTITTTVKHSRKIKSAYFLMLNHMEDDMIKEFKASAGAKAVQDVLQVRFSITSITQVCALELCSNQLRMT